MARKSFHCDFLNRSLEFKSEDSAHIYRLMTAIYVSGKDNFNLFNIYAFLALDRDAEVKTLANLSSYLFSCNGVGEDRFDAPSDAEGSFCYYMEDFYLPEYKKAKVIHDIFKKDFIGYIFHYFKSIGDDQDLYDVVISSLIENKEFENLVAGMNPSEIITLTDAAVKSFISVYGLRLFLFNDEVDHIVFDFELIYKLCNLE